MTPEEKELAAQWCQKACETACQELRDAWFRYQAAMWAWGTDPTIDEHVWPLLSLYGCWISHLQDMTREMKAVDKLIKRAPRDPRAREELREVFMEPDSPRGRKFLELVALYRLGGEMKS